jgi:hypothetical protein
MALHRNFVPYQDFYCKRCSPNRFQHCRNCPERFCPHCFAPCAADCGHCPHCARPFDQDRRERHDCDRERRDGDCDCDFHKTACEKFGFCRRDNQTEFASFIHKDKCVLKCGDALPFRKILSSDGCGWHCVTACIGLARGVYYINLFGSHSSKCGGTLALCSNNDRLPEAHAFLDSCSNAFYINTIIKVEKREKISVRNVSDSLIKIEMARLNIFRLV